jgi:hypothetical protein
MPSSDRSGPVKIACTYPNGALAAEWFQFVRRLRSQLARVSVNARIPLVPVSAVPADAEMVVVPATAAKLASVQRPGGRVIPVVSREPQAVPDELIAALGRQAPAAVEAGGPRPTIVRRGFEVVDWPAATASSAGSRRR